MKYNKKINIINKDTICCFTGHRPKSLPWGYSNTGIRYFLFKRKLKKSIIKAIEDGYTLFISGMALGYDMLAAELVLELKKIYPNIKLECAIPCINQCSKWSKESIMQYQNICNKADFVTNVSDTYYFNGCMAKRNKYMVDKSSRIIACYNGSAGGTQQTIRMAEDAGLNVVIVKP